MKRQSGQIHKWISKSKYLYEKGNVESAIEALSSCPKAFRNSYEYKTTMIKFLLEAKRLGEAENKTLDLLNAYPGDRVALSNLVGIYLNKGANEKALRTAERLHKEHPGFSESSSLYASVMQRYGHLNDAVSYHKKALLIQSVKWGKKSIKEKEDFNRPEVETLMWHTLENLASAGVHAFPTAGTLLGLVRDGELLPHDKDMDFSLPFSEMDRANKLLVKSGWKRVSHNIIPLINPIAYYHEEVKISLDMFGIAVERKSGKYITGFWMKGVPKEWNRITEVPEFDLKRIETPEGGKCWYPKNPESIVSRFYGEGWRSPDPSFESVVSGGHVRGFSLLTQCYAYQKLYSCISNGQVQKAKNIAASIRKKSDDASMNEVCNRILSYCC